MTEKEKRESVIDKVRKKDKHLSRKIIIEQIKNCFRKFHILKMTLNIAKIKQKTKQNSSFKEKFRPSH
jgi:hypothetical protein